MAALDSNSKVEEEEQKLYEWIYNMNSTDDLEEKENVPSSPEHTPEYLKIDGERSPHAVAGERLNMDALDNVLGIPELEVNVESFEEKPWRKPGAVLSDYFNYGFDEETWKEYSKKQKKLHAAIGKTAHSKIKVLVGHTRHGKEEPCCSQPFSNRQSERASRGSSAAIHVIGGHPGSSSRGKVCQSLSNDGSNTQVVTEMSPHQLHPFSFFPYTHKYEQSFLFIPGGPSLSNIATLDSGLFKGFGDPLTSLYPGSSGVSSAIRRRRRKASSAEMTDTAKEEKCDKDRDRYKGHGHDKNSKRRRERERERCFTSRNSWEEARRHRDSAVRGQRRHSFERFGGGKKERHRHTSKGRKNSSCSRSSRTRKDDEDRDSQSRHKHKKAKRRRKDKESNEMLSAD